jgi:DNA-binding CsgD family transcriptional regulator
MPDFFRNIAKITLFLLPLAGIQAQPSPLANREPPEIKQYLSNNFATGSQNWGICQNPVDGKVYFASTEGLLEYNGITWTRYSLPGKQIIRSVLADSKGNIFSGSFEDFGIWEKNENCELQYRSLAEAITIEKNDEIWKIYEQDERIYFQSFTSIYIYDYTSINLLKAPFTMLFMFPVNGGFITQIFENGLFRIEDDQFTFIEGSDIFNDKKVHCVLPLNDQQLLIATAGDGLYSYNGKEFRFLNTEASAFLKLNTCNAALVVNDSLLVFGSILNGIIFTDYQGNIFNRFNKSNGLNNNSVLSLCKSTDNGLWIGLDQGVNFLDLASPFVHYANTSGTLGTIYALHRKDNTLFIGTNHGLFRSRINSRTEYHQFEDVQLIPNSQGHTWTIQEFGDQILCGHNEGTFLVSDNALQKISDITGGWCIKPYNEYLIEGTYTGLALFQQNESGQWSLRNKVKGFFQPVKYLEPDYLGLIWAAHHQKGIYRLELNETLDSVVNSEFFSNIGKKESSLGVFEVNNRVVFTNGDSIYTYDYVKREVIPFSLLNTDLGEFRMAEKILHYDRNLYWFITDQKIALFEIRVDFSANKRREIIQKGLNLAAGDVQILKLEPSVILIPNRECFDTYNLGLQEVDVDDRIHLEKLSFTGLGRTAVFCPGQGEISVPWFMNNLTVLFSNPAMFAQREKSYEYRIPQIDPQWHTTTSGSFNYLNMKYGDYTVEIKSLIDTGILHSYPFTIKRPWYATRLAYLGFALVFLTFIYIVYRIFRYELQRQKHLIKMKLKEEKLESELDHKSYELMLTMRYLMHKNEIFSELRKEIDAIKQISAKYPVKNIKSMERIITEGLEVQTEDWKNAMNKLKFSQQGFFKKLKEKYPDLTNNDLRLCSYLRMNFSTKEIARLLNISTRAVEISRYRLRKKMNLSHLVNLTEHLMSETFSEATDEERS